MLGICNGFQVLCEAGLLPGALLVNPSLRFVCRQVDVRSWRTRTRRSPRACDAGESLSMPVKHTVGRYFAPHDGLERARAQAARCCRATRRERTRTARCTTSPASPTSGKNVFGLMPHPEHAVDPLTGSTDGAEALPIAARALPGALTVLPMSLADQARALGLTDSELERIRELLGRDPNQLELAVFSLLWSEHCAYKHSKKLLRTLPTEGERVICRARARTPAWWTSATGSRSRSRSRATTTRRRSSRSRAPRPASAASCATSSRSARGRSRCSTRCASASLDSQRTRYLLERVVAGIAAYGNSVGVPTVGGEIYFEAPYEHNCLVNAMCVGLAPAERLVRSAAAGTGNVVVLLGARTGRDGIGGASVLASAELDEGDHDKRPSVQIGDPLEESKLIECCLELVEQGPAWSRSRTSAPPASRRASARWRPRASVGIDIDVSRVPLREPDMEPFEIMISESQERMLCVVEPVKLVDVLDVCGRWETNATAIGSVTDTSRLRVFDGERARSATCRSARWSTSARSTTSSRPSPADPLAVLRRRRPRSCRRRREPQETFSRAARLAQRRQPQVGLRAVRLARRQPHRSPARAGRRRGAEARLRRAATPAGRSPSRSTATGGGSPATPTSVPPRRSASAPRTWPASEPSRSASPTASTSATPRSRTSPGSSTRPSRAWAPPAARFGVPVVGGNVSLYNEGPEGPIYPTPVVGMVGELPDAARAGRSGVPAAGRRRRSPTWWP